MASRENQGLQAALIVFVLITIALAVTTYVYFRKAEELGAQADAAQQQIQDANAQRDAALTDNQRLKEMLGYDIAEQMAVIEKNFAEDMAKFDSNYADTDPKNYRTLPEHLELAALARHARAVDAERREQQALAEKQTAEENAAQQIAAADQKFQTAVTTYQDERTQFGAERTRLNTERQQLAGRLTTKDQEITAVTTQATQAQEQYAAKIKTLEEARRSLLDQKREREQTSFETAHGRITFVNPGDRIVWIDLGLGDGLQRHTNFSVYDQNVNEYSPEHVKGRIEVTKLIDRHLAEARILDEDQSNPIVQGDLIYTPAWRPGQFLHFAVAGMIDINGDGQEDKELLRNIIYANGGVIDAEVDATGNVAGNMTVNTRYLIIGERPDETAGQQALAAYARLYDEAALKGVELMPLPRFLALMGYKSGSRTVPLGGAGGAMAEEAPAAQPQPRGAAPRGEAQPAAPGFRPRRPPARGAEGAF
ncbi:MAG: hypothetical protein KY475_12455 [Planctomycetes bacterium]|nr:hypothetical protein [Planctomycetota bacterium]